MTESISVLGLGAMGLAMAETFLAHGHATTVWNRSAEKADELVLKGAVRARTPAEAIEASSLTIVCVLDYQAVQEVLGSAGALSGRVLVNLTTGTPTEARALSGWAAERGADYLDGGIMAVPAMIGSPESLLLYSGSSRVFETHRQTLEMLGRGKFVGTDPGSAALFDLALLGAMYSMFAGVHHGAAMVATAGITAAEFVELAAPWVTAMTGSLQYQAQFIDKGDYTTDVQSLDFNKQALDMIAGVSAEHGVSTEVIARIQALVDRQVAEGHGADSFSRMIESIKQPR